MDQVIVVEASDQERVCAVECTPPPFDAAFAEALVDELRLAVERQTACPILQALHVGCAAVAVAALGHPVRFDDERGRASLTRSWFTVELPAGGRVGAGSVLGGNEPGQDP